MSEPGSGTEKLNMAELQQRLAHAEAGLVALSAELQSLRAAMPIAAAQVSSLAPQQPAAAKEAPPLSPNLPPAPPPSFAAAAPVAPQRKQSLENKIGSQWFARIGILALLLGVGWFLKLAIDNHWIHPTPLGKTLGGLLVGAAVVLWSERFRRKGYVVFSYALKALGSGVLYLTLWAAFHLFGLLPAPVALLLMIAVTAWNATMALLQDSELLAAYALVGGFLTPALLGSGGNHEVFLFTYIFAIDAAVLWLLMKKPWPRLLLASFPATVVYFIGWYGNFTKDQAGLTAFFILLLSAPFVAITLFGKKRDDDGEGVLLPLGTASFLSLSMYSVLEDSGRHAWLPWVAVLFAAGYILLARLRRGVAAEAVHTAIAIVLLTVALPLKLTDHALTIAWLAEGVALVWASGWVGMRAQPRVSSVLRWLGIGAMVLGLSGALIISMDTANRIIFNMRFATELCGVAGAMATAWLLSSSATGRKSKTAITFIIAAHLLALWAGVREIQTYFRSANDAGLAESFTISAWLMVYAAALLAVGFWKRAAFIRWQGLVLLVFTIAKVFLYDVRDLSSGYRVLSFMGLGALLLGVSFAYQRDWLNLREEEPATQEAAPQ